MSRLWDAVLGLPEDEVRNEEEGRPVGTARRGQRLSAVQVRLTKLSPKVWSRWFQVVLLVQVCWDEMQWSWFPSPPRSHSEMLLSQLYTGIVFLKLTICYSPQDVLHLRLNKCIIKGSN